MIVSGVFALPFDDSTEFTAPPAFGSFRVLHQIGSGAMGPVFRTFEARGERLVAVKAFRLDVVPEVAGALADGLAALVGVGLAHPAVVSAIDAGLEGSTAFLASEYVGAETLDVSPGRMAPVDVEAIVPLLAQVSEAIEAAWAAGLGHGALHPRDIFVMSDQQTRVAGFGVVSALEALNISVPVRHPYAAPERALGGAWDMRADVYSLGVIAHELLLGRRPAEAPGPAEALPDGWTQERRAAIDGALSGALQADPARRFATPTAFMDALASGEGVEADARAAEPGVWQPQAPHEPEWELDVPVVVPMAHPEVAPRRSGLMWMIGAAVVAISGFGYWWQAVAPAPVAEVPAGMMPVDDSPIGTDVVVAQPLTPAAPVVDAEPVAVETPASAGRVLVRSVPADALVLVNGRPRGRTPAVIRDLAFGTYNIAVSRPGYERGGQRITVSRGTPARELTIELTAASTVATASTGAVYVVTRPAGATVWIDGRSVGTTPVRVPELAPGPHTVRLDLAGHRSLTTTVVVRAAQQTPVRVSLEVR